MRDKPIYVAFAVPKLEKNLVKLKEGKFEDKQLYEFIERAIDDPKKIRDVTYFEEYQLKRALGYLLSKKVMLVLSVGFIGWARQTFKFEQLLLFSGCFVISGESNILCVKICGGKEWL